MYRTLRYSVTAIAIGAALTVAACSTGAAAPSAGANGAGAVQVKLTDMKFEPTKITAKVGQPVQIQLQNAGAVVHDLTISDQSVHVAVEPGKSGTAEFTPTKAGTYKIICSQPGHEAAGMVAELVVE